MNLSKAIAATTGTVVIMGVRRATKYLSDKLVVNATAHPTMRKPKRGDSSYMHVILTAGAPNWAQRRFIARCKKAGEPFPVKKTQLQPWPVPRAKKKAAAKK